MKNQDLWLRLEAATQAHPFELIRVRGHAGDRGNERADQLAREPLEAGRGDPAARKGKA